MKQFKIEDGKLCLFVKRSPLIIRLFLFLLAFIPLILPVLGMIVYAITEGSLHLGFLFGIAIFGLLGFYLLRLALWNSYGKEFLVFAHNTISYYADYGWFKDGKKHLALTNNFKLSFERVGYENENLGVLVINSMDDELQLVTKLPIEQLTELIDNFNQQFQLK